MLHMHVMSTIHLDLTRHIFGPEILRSLAKESVDLPAADEFWMRMNVATLEVTLHGTDDICQLRGGDVRPLRRFFTRPDSVV